MTSPKELADQMAVDLFGMSPTEARNKGICIQCGQPARPRCYSAAGWREYQISALCEQCFDEICGAD